MDLSVYLYAVKNGNKVAMRNLDGKVLVFNTLEAHYFIIDYKESTGDVLHMGSIWKGKSKGDVLHMEPIWKEWNVKI